MPGIIDADTHIAESESMWALIDKEMYHRRPVLVAAPDDTLYRDFNVLWLIDGNIFPKADGKGGFRIITPTASKREANRTNISVGCREITDVAGEADEDIPYLAEFIGEDNLLIGSDYGHNDPAEEKALVQTMKTRPDLPAALVNKILRDNPKEFYGL